MTLDEAISKIRDLREIQGQHGTWNASGYMLGLYNGLELALSILEDERAPEYRKAPAEDGHEASSISTGDRCSCLTPIAVATSEDGGETWTWSPCNTCGRDLPDDVARRLSAEHPLISGTAVGE